MKTCNSASIKFAMLDVEAGMEAVDPSQPTDMQEDDAFNDTCLEPLRTFMDVDIVVARHISQTGAGSLTPTADSPKETVHNGK